MAAFAAAANNVMTAVMQIATPPAPIELYRHAASRLGGSFFVGGLMATSLFCLFLAGLRAEKLFFLPLEVTAASAEDLVAFWRASQMALAGEAAEAYDRLAFRATLDGPTSHLIWWNPPHAFLLIWPLALAPYGVAKALWIGASAAAMAQLARLAHAPALGVIAAILSPALFASLLALQTGPFIALGLLAALLLAEKRPILSGLLLALLTVKPQYGLMAPAFLAAIGAWRAFGAAAAFTMFLTLISAFLFGVESWRAFFAAPFQTHLTDVLHRDMIAVGHSLTKLGSPAALSFSAQGAVMLLCAGSIWLAARRLPRHAAIGFTLIASALAAPSIWVYDWPLIVGGLLMLMRDFHRWPISLQIISVLVWLSPLYSLGLTTMNSALIAPVLLIVFFAFAIRWAASQAQSRP